MNPFLLPPGATYRRRSRKPLVAVVTTAAVLATGGVGYAAWSVSAVGSSEARSGAPVVSVVTPATPVNTLYPGGSTPLYFTVNNGNDFPVTYTSATFSTITSDNPTACPVENVNVVASATFSVTVPPNTSSAVQAPAAAISMLATAPNGCQNRIFTVATTVTGLSG